MAQYHLADGGDAVGNRVQFHQDAHPGRQPVNREENAGQEYHGEHQHLHYCLKCLHGPDACRQEDAH